MIYITEVKEVDGEYVIELNEEVLAQCGFKLGDELIWTDNKDGSFSLTKKESLILKTEMTNLELNRSANVLYDKHNSVYIVKMYENDMLNITRHMSVHNEQYAEDCAENWINKYGEFQND